MYFLIIYYVIYYGDFKGKRSKLSPFSHILTSTKSHLLGTFPNP